MSDTQIEILQQEMCRRYQTGYVGAFNEQMSGFATATGGLLPINGLRHPLAGGTTGWYIWCGEEFSSRRDFFQPIHTKHIYEKYPSIAPLLGLPPGYRFLQAGDYIDVWFDPLLLSV
ncbi:immunity protein Imm33 domain-containing protein [Edaphobacter bradus]|uniref:immunity protein Imm33 domain-containing protein n=1 Tax=Edaphobacter bradus TaxID=2259016 RepID=UPI0021DFA735|nr:hypothetical protein [Edaphobacter bradus]